MNEIEFYNTVRRFREVQKKFCKSYLQIDKNSMNELGKKIDLHLKKGTKGMYIKKDNILEIEQTNDYSQIFIDLGYRVKVINFTGSTKVYNIYNMNGNLLARGGNHNIEHLFNKLGYQVIIKKNL